ncbi:M20 family metallopeptidase [Dictyobacter arantiisoli]|nr:M20 family metallopeptidase [Dictyobacter arantiisoli]
MPEHFSVEQVEPVMERFYADLQAIVNIDSGTFLKAGVDAVGFYLQQRFTEFGFTTSFDIQEKYGHNLVAVHTGSNPEGPRLLCIGHIDTVFPANEAMKRPFALTEREGVRVAKGPGILDMKSGVLMGLYALHVLIEADQAAYQRVTFVCNSDEEVGSPASKPLIARLAQEADAVLVMEPGRIVQRIVSARKGIANYRVEVFGRSAHAGVEPEHGRNAIVELSRQVMALDQINGTIPGATLNVGIIHGGQRTNIVPDYAYCDIDVRVSDLAGLEAIEAALKQMTEQTMLDGTHVVLSGGIGNVPFELTPQNKRLVELVKEAGLTLDLQIEDVSSGGASDANTTSGLGIPTVDGLGAAGGLAHNPDEYIEIEQVQIRIALLCAVIEHICDYYQSGRRL